MFFAPIGPTENPKHQQKPTPTNDIHPYENTLWINHARFEDVVEVRRDEDFRALRTSGEEVVDGRAEEGSAV